MPRRIHILADAQIYHVYNRSVGKEYIFNKLTYLNHALELIDFYRFNQRLRYSKFRDLNKDFRAEYENNFRKQNPIIEIYSFAFMPNHFHFLLKQMHSDGIMNFTRKLQTSFSKFFNLKNDRHGNLFESSFKAKRVDTDEEFWHVSRYIHLNPVTAFLIDYNQLEDYPWTSFPFYAKSSTTNLIQTTEIINKFSSRKKYIQFVKDQADYQRELGIIKHLMME